ncbi:MAG: hypothetical protein E7211_08635 [Clostridium lundense]|nr:hypothetical protein [Clostridium lundense]
MAQKITLDEFLNGHEVRFECIHRQIYYRCLYKINGKKYKAKICFETGEILVNGAVVRRCRVC